LKGLMDDPNQQITKESIEAEINKLKEKVDNLETGLKDKKYFNEKVLENLEKIFGDAAKDIKEDNLEAKMAEIQKLVDDDKKKIDDFVLTMRFKDPLRTVPAIVLTRLFYIFYNIQHYFLMYDFFL